ncbi:MAG: hypothetical protein WCD82_11220 [Xanthobacteraceae bacterium]
MSSDKRLERSGADARKGLIGWLADTIYEASLRRTLRSIKAH